MRRAVIAAVVVVLLVVAAVALFAGSETRLASGTTIAGIDVGGLERDAAAALLEQRSDAVEHAPVTFVAAGREFRFTASQLGVRSDWAGAVAEASRRDRRIRARARRASHPEPPVRRRRPAEDVRLSVGDPCRRRADRPRGRPPGRRGGPASHRPAGRRRPGAGGSEARPRGGVDRDRRVARVARARRPGLAADRPRGADDDHRRARRGAARIPRRHLGARDAPRRRPDRGAVAGSDRRARAASERRRHRASHCPGARRTACWRASRRT